MHHLTKKTWTSHRTKLKRMLTLFVRQERRVYYLHRYKARKFPSKYLTSINDGMDQHTTNIPNLRRISKSMAGLKMVGTHLVGSIIHSGQVPDGKAFHGCFDYYQFAHDSNLTISILLDVLVKWTEEQHKLPPVLYLQFDNCVRENKNRFMLTLLAILVQLKVFKKVWCAVRVEKPFLFKSHRTTLKKDKQTTFL